MPFRWIALLAVWTCLIGPICGAPGVSSARPPQRPVAPPSPWTPHTWHSSTELHR
ncbi:MAG TPA: hypothetical protein VMS17_20410 [Gemmataceae bacterium]|nr:hypothetical protein [Gemmataceae bacterium]